MSEPVEVGRVLRPKGLKGEVKVELSSPERLDILLDEGQVLFEKGGEQKMLFIEKGSWNNGFAYLVFQGYTSLDAAETLREGVLLADKSSLPALPEGRYYHFELVGFAVLFGDGEPLGMVAEVVEYPSCDALEVRLVRGQLLTLPMTKQVILKVDKEEQRILVNRDAVEELL